MVTLFFCVFLGKSVLLFLYRLEHLLKDSYYGYHGQVAQFLRKWILSGNIYEKSLAYHVNLAIHLGKKSLGSFGQRKWLPIGIFLEKGILIVNLCSSH